MVTYSCPDCNKKYKNKYDYMRHINRKTPCDKNDVKEIDISDHNETYDKYNEHKETQNNKINKTEKYICFYCNNKFVNNSSLTRHTKLYCKTKKQQNEEKNSLLEQLKIEMNELKNKQNDEMNKLKNKLKETDDKNMEYQKIKKQNDEYQIIINNALLNDNKLIYSVKKTNLKKPRLVCVNDIASSSNSLQSFTNQPAIFTFNDKTFEYVNDIYDKFWFDGKEIVLFIGYKDHINAMKDHIKDEYKKYLKDITRGGESPPLDHNEKNKIYISEEGLYQLLTTSKLNNDIIKTFQNWVFEEIIPSIRKTGKYEIPNMFSNIKSFYNDNMITPFLGKKVVYLGITSNIVINNGIVEYLAKYGKTGCITRRDIEEHRNFFNDFKVVFIRECDNYEDIEKLFELELKALELFRKVEIKGTMCKELFTVKEDYIMDNIINMLNNLIDNNPLKSIKEKNNKIKELESNLELEKLKEITKQRELDIKQRELENEKIKLETKKLELELKLKLKK